MSASLKLLKVEIIWTIFFDQCTIKTRINNKKIITHLVGILLSATAEEKKVEIKTECLKMKRIKEIKHQLNPNLKARRRKNEIKANV